MYSKLYSYIYSNLYSYIYSKLYSYIYSNLYFKLIFFSRWKKDSYFHWKRNAVPVTENHTLNQIPEQNQELTENNMTPSNVNGVHVTENHTFYIFFQPDRQHRRLISQKFPRNEVYLGSSYFLKFYIRMFNENVGRFPCICI